MGDTKANNNKKRKILAEKTTLPVDRDFFSSALRLVTDVTIRILYRLVVLSSFRDGKSFIKAYANCCHAIPIGLCYACLPEGFKNYLIYSAPLSASFFPFKRKETTH